MQTFGFLSYALGAKCLPGRLAARSAALAAAVAGCATTGQTYAGKLEPEAGVCNSASRATLHRQGAIVQFTPQDGVLTLDGTVSAEGRVVAAQQTVGLDRKPYRLSFAGQLAGNDITGMYVTPRCRYRVILRAAGT